MILGQKLRNQRRILFFFFFVCFCLKISDKFFFYIYKVLENQIWVSVTKFMQNFIVLPDFSAGTPMLKTHKKLVREVETRLAEAIVCFLKSYFYAIEQLHLIIFT